MSALTEAANSTTTRTPISDSIANPVRLDLMRAAELHELSEPQWHNPVARQLEEISRLEEGWDGFRTGPIRRDVMNYSIQILEQTLLHNTPAPHIAPMSHEGIMLEWHENGIDFEIEIESPGRLWFSFEDSIEGIEEENMIYSNLEPLALPIEKLTKRYLVSG